jgi:hypothetical protein
LNGLIDTHRRVQPMQFNVPHGAGLSVVIPA